MDEEHNKNNPVIIKRIKKVHGGHHGGSWKIAYADFVTAMMTFFLLMWLLSLLNKYQLQGIAEYFKTPMKEAFSKQDNIAKKDALKPDQLGPTTFNNKGSKEKTENSVDKNLGIQDKATNPVDKTQGIPQNQTILDQQHKTASDQNQNQKMSAEQEAKQMQQMKSDLENKLNSDPQISQYKNALNFVITADGLKIILKDLENKPMFSEGKTDFQKYAKTIMNWLSQQINAYPNQIVIIGHTDTVPYASGSDYSNWDLSADRASATRKALIKAGMKEDKVLRIIGGADTDLLDKTLGINPSNRRIEIIILTNDASKRIQNE